MTRARIYADEWNRDIIYNRRTTLLIIVMWLSQIEHLISTTLVSRPIACREFAAAKKGKRSTHRRDVIYTLLKWKLMNIRVIAKSCLFI